ncbi:sulfatase-like hydrolase/transferase [Botrimarina sp.]|uniref:sulfatase-like hydrolase/transferase n=1 Tax=Botrimarina sp. TaxID=2795802 RepID=UPI0032F012A4
MPRLLVLTLAVTLCVAHAAAAPTARNVVLIMADDIGLECFGCYGSEQHHTPRIDRLAETGLRFTNCFSQPLCTPSRVKIMTGQSNARNYVGFGYMDPALETFGHRLQAAGRRTLCVGKWQLHGFNSAPAVRRLGAGLLPEQAGFDDYCLWQITNRPKRYWNALLETPRGEFVLGPNEYGPDYCARVVCDFIDAHADEPFFVYYPMMLVHAPFLPTPDSPDRAEQDRQENFKAMVAYMDRLVGRIVDRVEASGLREETLVLFTGDNGTNRKIVSRLEGRTIRGGKGLTTSAGVRVPLVASWPGVAPAGGVTDALVDFSDFSPTLSDLVGAEHPECDGHSFAPLLRGESFDGRDWVYCYHWPRPTRPDTAPKRFACDARWKLYDDGAFYDTSADPLEETPLDPADLPVGASAAYEKLTEALASMPSEGQRVVRAGE